MRITALETFTFPVPFRVVFRHASASRARAENVIIAARSACGRTGYGEGCPRSYVTGETIASCVTFVQRHARPYMESVRDVDGLRQWIADHAAPIDANPAAFCAMELATLDLIGKIDGLPLEALVHVPPLGGSLRYSAILGNAPYPVFRWQLHRYRRERFIDFKLKVTGSFRRDRRRISAFRSDKPPRTRVRLDANNLWRSARDCIDHFRRLDADIFAIEEPLQAGDLAGFAEIAGACDCPIILDESLLRRTQLDRLDPQGRWIVNLRVSKMGGIIRSLDVARETAARGVGLVVGAQVGETSLLTRAAFTIANAFRGSLIACEGAFGTHLLQRDLASPCLMFGRGGRLEPASVSGLGRAGLGLGVEEAMLRRAE